MNFGRSTFFQTAAGLFVCAGVWRYVVAPKLLPHRSISRNIDNNTSSTSSSSSSSSSNNSVTTTSSSNNILRLDSTDELQRLGDGISVALFIRGLDASGAKEAKRAKSALEDVATLLQFEHPEIRFYIIDDMSAQIPALTLMTRLGLEHSHNEPYLVVLDKFVLTEKKFILTPTEPISSGSLKTFVKSVINGTLKPTLLGQSRPIRDRNIHCRSLFEVVTDSFHEIVLDPTKDVLLESYTKRCDACKAFAPRMRMFAQLCEKYLPSLLVAEIDILENDRDITHLPEKWTPALRIFLREESKGDIKTENQGVVLKKTHKKSALLDYGNKEKEVDVEVNSKEEEEDENRQVRRRRRNSLISVSSSNPLVPVPPPTRVILPTLPDLLDFVEEASNGRLVASAELYAKAAEAEEEAMELEQVYDVVLNFMQLYKAYNTLLSDEEQEKKEKKREKKKKRRERMLKL
jgi:hypothetical protein